MALGGGWGRVHCSFRVRPREPWASARCACRPMTCDGLAWRQQRLETATSRPTQTSAAVTQVSRVRKLLFRRRPFF
eukprot:5727171-Amphidinium_carterae.1